ncbi:MAG TPA: winged helix-turn-helix domain-containing protein [Rhodothermales bacterium]
MSSAVLVVHVEEKLRASAREALELAGHLVQEADEFNTAWRLFEAGRPDVILIPWTALKSVRESLARLRDQDTTRQSRVIVWAFQPDIRDAINALEFGADDCLGVPFDDAELVARVNACLRRPPATSRPDQLTAGPLVLDKGVHCLLVNNQLVDLAPTEFRLMAFFLENQGRVYSRDELLRRAWSKNIKAGHRTVDVHVRRLRQVLEPFGCDDMIQTVRGFGYRFAHVVRDGRARKGDGHSAQGDRL